MLNPRMYGNPSFTIAVIHGGPGAGGEMAPVARELASTWGVLEPIQTAMTLEGQVEELRRHLQDHSTSPATLIGYSWGAWLSYILAAIYSSLVKKLILVSSGPFEEKYVKQLSTTRFERLNPEERKTFDSTIQSLALPNEQDKDTLLATLGKLAAKADSYDPLSDEEDTSDRVCLRGDRYQQVWEEAAEMRRNGKLLELGKNLTCPVIAIHGDYDPHPAEGVRQPLSATLKDFRFILLNKCGHTPWKERQAKEKFYAILRNELSNLPRS